MPAIYKNKIELSEIKAGQYIRANGKFYFVFRYNKYTYRLVEFNPSNHKDINIESSDYNDIDITNVYSARGDSIIVKNKE